MSLTSQADLQGIFPYAWKSCKIEDSGTVIVGQQKTSNASSGQSYPYLRAANVGDGVLRLSELSQMPFSNPDRYRLRNGDILITEGSGSRNLVGRAAIYNGELADLMFQNHLLRFRPFTGINSPYALLVFRAYQKTGIFAGVAKGIGISHIGMSQFRQLPFPIPPRSVQMELALAARAVQDNLDLLQGAVENALGELSQLMPRARDSLILGTLATGWHDGSAGDSPWPLMPAAEVVEKDSPIVRGIDQPGPEVQGGIPYARGEDIQDGSILLDQLKHTSPDIADRYERSSLQTGDVVLNIIRHTRVARVPPELSGGNLTRGSARLRPGESIRSDFLSHWLSSASAQQWLQSQLHGIDMPILNLRDVRRLPVPVPPLAVQVDIAQKLNDISLRAEKLKRSFNTLNGALPGLERDLLESFAYGAYAAAVSRALTRDSERALSEEVAALLQLREEPSQGSLASYNAITEEESWQEAPELAEEDIAATVPKISGRVQITSADDIATALLRSNEPVTPEELFISLELAETAIDSFFAGIRDLIHASQVEIVRADNIQVWIVPRS
jgi:type I restriction enzyme S subunit